VSARTVLASGSVLDEIGQKAEALNAALLVLGARGEGFLRRQVLGTTSERLLRRTTRPVLVVRQTPHAAYRRVLVALDFSPWSLQALAVARSVAPHAHLVLFNAFQVPFEEKLHFAGVDAATIEHYRQHWACSCWAWAMMTDGLKLAAGPALHRILAGATRTRWHALGSGVLVTALVQSSSAVTVAAIGFVNAGLLALGRRCGCCSAPTSAPP
jgi:nucleotide-binding universal stress UspA family protein